MFRAKYIVYGLFLSLVVVLTACTPRSLREAQTVVTEADSVWRGGQMYGIDYGDSVTLAEAYQRLDRAQTIFPDEFAHSCYHYGRLLRKKDNPVEAMQTFLNATHTRTRDYHILGRVYSNMGSICHLAGEYNLSYEMCEQSADMFLKNGDTINYYYALNDMAFELAEQGDIQYTNLLLDSIQKFNDQGIISKSLETRALLYLRCEQYEKAIQTIDSMLSNGIYDLFYILMKAQAFEHLNKMDSAISYAHLIIQSTSNNRFLIPAYYILLHDNNTLTHDSILSLTYKRADAQKEWAVQNGYYANAVLLLQQDLNKKYDWSWIYTSCATIFILGILALVYLRRRRRQHQLLSQQVEDLENKNQELMQEHTTYKNNLVAQLEQNCRVISESKDFPDNLNWKEFEVMCKTVDANFNMLASKLSHIGTLNETEIRLCILVFFDLDRNQISDVLPYAKNGVGKLKYRVAQKLGVEGKNLRKNLIHIAINERIDH